MKNYLLNKQITIIGLGLIGGSLAMALKVKGFTKVVGFSKTLKAMKKATEFKAVDRIASSLKEAVKDSDMVIVCTPISEMKRIFTVIKDHLKPGCIVTDVGSTKKMILKWAENMFLKHVFFIGGHPMAGKETSGIGYADRNLFRDCGWCLIPTRLSTEEVMREMKDFVRLVGARPFIVDAETHDKAVASISHLPFLLSSMLVNIVSRKSDWNMAKNFAAGGFRDMSRLAGGSIKMHTDICQTNKENIISLMNQLTKQSKKVSDVLKKNGRKELTHFLTEARNERMKWFIKSRFNRAKI